MLASSQSIASRRKGGFQCVSKISGASRHPLGLRLRHAYDTRAEERVSVIP